MKYGYYWMQLDDGEWEVVEIDGDMMLRCGSDVPVRLKDGRWEEFGAALPVVAIVGPISQPGSEQ